MMLKPIGIFGGTFDPIHFGHLRTSLEICENLGMEQIRFIPSYIPPHREQPETTAALRQEMVKRAIANEPLFELDCREIKRGGPSFMVDTLADLREDFPAYPLCLIIGMDAFSNINHWHRWQELLNYAHIVVCHRPDAHSRQQWPDEINEFFHRYQATSRRALHDALSGLITIETITQLAISATDIRNRLKNKQSIRYLVPDEVLNLIELHNVYK